MNKINIIRKEGAWNDIEDIPSSPSSTLPNTTHDICADKESSSVYTQPHILSHSSSLAPCATGSNKSNIHSFITL